MANYKADIEIKLLDEKAKLLKDVPEFIYTYFQVHLTSISSELRSHIAYAKDLINFLHYYSSILDKEISDITLDDMQEVDTRLLNDYFSYITQYSVKVVTKKGKEVEKVRKNSASSKSRKLAALKKFYLYLNEKNLIKNNPIKDMKISRPDTSNIDDKLESEEIKEIIREMLSGENIETSKQKKAHERFKLRDVTIFIILSHTGIRVSELVSLDISDVDTRKCTIRVTRKNNKIEEIPYPEEVSKYIDSYLAYRERINNKVEKEYKDALFISQKNTRLTTESVRILLRKYTDRIGINISGCHTIRKTLLSSLYNKTGDIRLTARIGGHSVATASKYYADVDDKRLRDTMRSFNYKDL